MDMINENKVFEEMYCTTFLLLDLEWSLQKGTYLQFPQILETTKQKIQKLLERREIKSLEDLRQKNRELGKKIMK